MQQHLLGPENLPLEVAIPVIAIGLIIFFIQGAPERREARKARLKK